MHDIDERLCQLFFQVLYLFRLPSFDFISRWS